MAAKIVEGFSSHSSIITVRQENTRYNEAPSNKTTTSSESGDVSATDMSINLEKIPAFDIAEKRLLPLIKHNSWLKAAKGCLNRANVEGESVFFKPINKTCRVEFGYTIAMLNDEGYYHYVLNSYLREWHISEAALIQRAHDNLRERVTDEGEKIWHKSDTGIQFVQGLDALTASVILLPDVIEMLGIPDGDPVAVIPSPDMVIIGGTQNFKHLCIMGEVGLKLKKNDDFMSTQPLRLSQGQWSTYEANTANDEHPLPRTPDEIKMLKRALKMQRKL